MAANSVAPGYQEKPALVRWFSDQRKWTPYLFVAPFFITFGIFTLWPMLRSLIMGFQEAQGFINQKWEWVGLANYIEALTNDKWVLVASKNFVIMTVGSLVTQIPVALLLAWFLTSPSLKFRGFFRTLFFIPAVLPGVTMGVVGGWFFNTQLGFANALWLALGGAERIPFRQFPQWILPMILLVSFWQWMGNHAIFFVAGMSGIDSSIIEASVVDGANGWQRATMIVMPLLRPVIAYVCITSAAGSLTLYDVAYMIVGAGDQGGGAGGQGWFFMTYLTNMAFSQMRMGYATAIGWLVFIVAIIITLLQLKLFNFGEYE